MLIFDTAEEAAAAYPAIERLFGSGPDAGELPQGRALSTHWDDIQVASDGNTVVVRLHPVDRADALWNLWRNVELGWVLTGPS